MKRRKDALCILLRASTLLLRRLLDLISEDSFHRIPSCLRRRAFDTDGIREHLARNRRSFLAHSPVGVVVFESTEYAARIEWSASEREYVDDILRRHRELV